MTIPNPHIRDALTLVENRLGLSATTLNRIGLDELFNQLAVGDIGRYVHELSTSSEHSLIWQRLIHALTIGETYFLRDKVHFRILRETILPHLILERRRQNDLHLTIWCAGCSTGEEPYSIATILYETLPDWNKWQIDLIGTDINQRGLDIAEKGIYRDWSFRGTSAQFKQRYFSPVDDGWQIESPIRDMVRFMRMNILNGIPTTQIDIIFARHMLMYLNPDQAQKAAHNLHTALVNDGWLILGQAEALRSANVDWLLHTFPGKPIYQKIDPNNPIMEPITYPDTTVAPQTSENNADYMSAIQAIHQGDNEQAVSHLDQLLEESPNHAKGHALLASVFANRKAYPEALAQVETALQQNGLLADAHYIKGLVLLEQDAEDNAMDAFVAALYCDRHHALAAMMLGTLHHNRGDTVQAKRNWRNARQAIQDKDDNDFVSDISDITVQQLRNIIGQHDISDSHI